MNALIFTSGGAVLHSCFLYHFVTFEAKFGHIGVNNPYIWWSFYEHEVMIGMFKDLGSLFFNFGSKAVVQSTSWRYLILLLRQNMAKSEKNSHVNGDIIAIYREKWRVARQRCHLYIILNKLTSLAVQMSSLGKNLQFPV